MAERRTKNWCFTSYDVSSEPFVGSRSKIEYLVYGRETCPETGRAHLQGFVVFKTRTKFSTVRRLAGNAHLEPMCGTCTQASEYCKKDGDFTEYGSIPNDARNGDKFANSIRLAAAGNLDEVRDLHPGLYLRYKRTLESLLSFTTTELEDSCGMWICGPPRCGKDYGARTKYKDSLYTKPLNKWWDGYQNEETVICDVEPFHASWLGYFLKIWSDRYPFLVEVKGGTIKIRPKRIIVTSNFEMKSVFNGEVLHALEAKFEVYDFINCPTGRFIPRPLFTADTRVLDLLNGVDEVDRRNTESISCGLTVASASENDESPMYMAWKDKQIKKILLPEEVSSDDDFQEIKIPSKKKKESSEK